MEIQRLGSQPSSKGPADWFTGDVRIDPLFQPNEHRRAASSIVTFEPGARTAWHTHPLGQTLIVISGVGRVQREGGPVEEVRPGDVGVVPSGREALAWRLFEYSNDTYCYTGTARWKGSRVDGESNRSRI